MNFSDLDVANFKNDFFFFFKKGIFWESVTYKGLIIMPIQRLLMSKVELNCKNSLDYLKI